MAIQFLNTGYFPDDAKLTFGTGSDLEIYHDGTHSYIDDVGTGSLYIKGGSSVQIESNTGENMIVCSTNAAVELYYDNSKKLETTSTGITVSDVMNWGSSRGTLHWGADRAIIRGQSGYVLELQSDGGTTVLVLDNSANATFSGSVTVGTKLMITSSSDYIDVISDDLYIVAADKNILYSGNAETLRLDESQNATFAGNVIPSSNPGGELGTGAAQWSELNLSSSAGIIWGNGDASIVEGTTENYSLSFNTYDGSSNSRALYLQGNNNATFAGDILTNTDSSSDIGKTATRWANIWVDNINGAAPRTGDYLPLAGGTMTGNIHFNDGINANFGGTAGAWELEIYTNVANDAYIKKTATSAGDLIIQNASTDGDIIFSSDDGSGGETTYFFLDGSQTNIHCQVDFRIYDSKQLQLGNGADLLLYHDGSNSTINNDTGDFIIKNSADNSDILFQSDNGSGGVATYFYMDGSAVNGTSVKGATKFPDASKIYMGTGGDLEIFHNGSQAYIENYTGEFNFTQHLNDGDMIFKCDDGSGGTTEYFRLDGGLGYNVVSKTWNLLDGVSLSLGASGDLTFRHDSADTLMDNYTGHLYIRQQADDKDIIFQGDDGSGGVETYFYLDGSAGSTDPVTRFPDNSYLKFGDAQDFSFVHTGTSYIQNYTGDLIIQNAADDARIRFQCDNGAGGTASYFDLVGTHAVAGTPPTLFTQWYDDSKIALGNGLDCQIWHDGTNTKIYNQTGDFKIGVTGTFAIQSDGYDENLATFTNDGDVQLFYDSSKKFQTTSAGATITGALSITGDGSNPVTFTETGAGKMTIAAPDDIILDAVSDIVLDADGADIRFKDAGVEYGRINNNSSGNFLFLSPISDKDIIFKGNDGGSEFVALTLDMSSAGSAFFNHDIVLVDNGKVTFGGGSDLQIYHDGSNNYIHSTTSDQDINILGNDGGATITALTMDMSAAGAATFNSSVAATTLTLSGKGTSAATVDGDGSTTMATKGWVESKLTGATLYQGTWDPDVSLNSGYGNPNLSSASLQVNGYYYICSADGTAEPNGTGTEPDSWHTGDWVIWNDDVGVSGEWQKIDNTTVLSGAGTGEYLARWTDTETLGDSVLLASGSDILMPQYLIHTGDTDTYFGFSAANTYKAHVGGSDRFEITGDVRVLGSTDFHIPAGRKLCLDGGGSTYITESSDGVIDFYGDGTFLVSMKQNGTQSEVVINEGSGDVDFRVEANNDAHAFFVEAESTGKVGIGTSTPGSRLSIEDGDLEFLTSNAATIKNKIIFSEAVWGDQSFWIEHDGAGAGAANLLKIYADDSGGTPAGIVLTRDTKVGIGTISPDAKLSVTSTGTTSEDILYLKSGIDNADEYLGMAFETGGGGNGPHGAIRVYNGPSSSDSYMSLLTTTNGGTLTQGLTQNHLGNVGIGTTSPATGLDVQTSYKQLTLGNTAGTQAGHLQFRRGGDGQILAKIGYSGATDGNTFAAGLIGGGASEFRLTAGSASSSYLTLYTTDIERVRVIGDGKVGIGTTTPDAKLEVNGGIIAGGKTTYTISSGSLTTTGTAVAGLSGESGGNGQSAGFIFTCFGGDGYQRIVYSCKNVGGTWDINKDIDEGVNAFDVTYAADGSDNITFTFKGRSATQSFTPKVTVEAIGTYINQSYIN